MEVVVATAIFSVTVVSLLIVRDQAIVNTAKAKNYRIARRLTMELLEKIHAGEEFDAGESEQFDEENYPQFWWRMKEVEVVELEEPELEFLKTPEKQGPGTGRPPGGGPGGGGEKLAQMMGGATEELKRYVVEVTYPAHTDEGSATFEVTTYYLKEPDAGALGNMLGGGAGPGGGGGTQTFGGLRPGEGGDR
jgi:hypothetical protein